MASLPHWNISEMEHQITRADSWTTGQTLNVLVFLSLNPNLPPNERWMYRDIWYNILSKWNMGVGRMRARHLNVHQVREWFKNWGSLCHGKDKICECWHRMSNDASMSRICCYICSVMNVEGSQWYKRVWWIPTWKHLENRSRKLPANGWQWFPLRKVQTKHEADLHFALQLITSTLLELLSEYVLLL